MVVGAFTVGACVSNSRLMSRSGPSLLMLRWWRFLRICPDRIDTRYNLGVPAGDMTFPAIYVSHSSLIPWCQQVVQIRALLYV